MTTEENECVWSYSIPTQHPDSEGVSWGRRPGPGRSDMVMEQELRQVTLVTHLGSGSFPILRTVCLRAATFPDTFILGHPEEMPSGDRSYRTDQTHIRREAPGWS